MPDRGFEDAGYLGPLSLRSQLNSLAGKHWAADFGSRFLPVTKMSSTAFSYAQAAKGHAISQPSPQLTSSPAPSSIKDDTTTTATTSVSAPSIASTDAETRDLDRTLKSEIEAVPSKQDPDTVSINGSGSSTASTSEQVTKAARESTTLGADCQPQTEDKGARPTSRTSRTNDGSDNRKGRKGKKGRANEKDSQSEQTQEDEKEKEASKPVLSEAPLPAVNVWAKRIEAQQAKAKAAITSTTTPAAVASVSSQEQKKRQVQEDTDPHARLLNGTNGDKVQKQPSDLSQGTDQAPRRSAPRGSRVVERDEKLAAPLPPVADASSWPDPKAAAATEETSRKQQEKADKVDTVDKESQEEIGAAKKKWINLDIIPTVVFNTPLPPRGGAKARGGARGGRDSGTARGSHSAPPSAVPGSAGDRANPVNNTAAPKAGVARPREGSIQSRPASQLQPAVPQVSKPDNAPRSQPKTATQADHTRDNMPEVTPVGFPIGSLSSYPRLTPSQVSSKRTSAVQDIRTEFGYANFETTRAPQERTNAHQKGSEYIKDGPHGQQYPIREARGERTRGGFRGRGGHNGGAGSHASASYAANGQYSMHASYSSRQNGAAPSPPPFSGQFSPHFNQQRGRGNKWGSSSQAAGRSGANGGPFSHKTTQVNEFPVAQYPAFVYTHPFDLVNVIRHQVEYYLSVENLCKDTWLRQHMDSQGFVLLSTIAGFKRMRDLVKDHELIRMACAGSDILDYGAGDDGIERLRNRDKWQNFVLPHSDRHEAARNDGPNVFTSYNNRQASQSHMYGGPAMHPGFPAPPAGVYPVFSEDQMYQPAYTNGIQFEHPVNGGAPNGQYYGSETQLSAIVPEYSPPLSPLTLESMTNFTDAQVKNLMVVIDNSDNASSSADSNAVPTQNGVNGVPETHNSVT